MLNVVPALMVMVAAATPAAAYQCPDGSPPPCGAARAPALPPADPNRIAILPFRTTAADPSLAYLHDGMVELLAAEFTGEGTARAVDPASALRGFQRAGGSDRVPLEQAAALRLARSMGAGQLLVGAIVGAPARVTLTATVQRVPGGDVLVPTVRVAGPADSLPALVAALSAQLLSRRAGESSAQGTQSTEALRAYLEGLAAYRRGRFREAIPILTRAIAADSQFLAPVMVLTRMGGYGVGVPSQVSRLAAANRSRLSARDQALLTGLLGPGYPGGEPVVELIAARENAVRVAPESPEAWFSLGDTYFHSGLLVTPDAWERARRAFEQSLQRDTVFTALAHLYDLAWWRQDSSAMRQLWPKLAAWGSGTELLEMYAVGDWLVDGDERARPAATRRLAGDFEAMGITATVHSLLGSPPRVVEQLFDTLARRAVTAGQRTTYLTYRSAAEIGLGHPTHAAAQLDSLEAAGARSVADRLRVLSTLSGAGGDSASGARAAARLAAAASATPTSVADGRTRVAELCVSAAWQVEHGGDALPRIVDALRAVGSGADSVAADNAGVCVLVLEAITTAGDGARAALERADAVLVTGPQGLGSWMNLAMARAWERSGDVARARVAAQRFSAGAAPVRLLVVTMREYGRLSALRGDIAEARRALRYYLGMRADPEPALIPERDSVRAALARLEGGR